MIDGVYNSRVVMNLSLIIYRHGVVVISIHLGQNMGQDSIKRSAGTAETQLMNQTIPFPMVRTKLRLTFENINCTNDNQSVSQRIFPGANQSISSSHHHNTLFRSLIIMSTTTCKATCVIVSQQSSAVLGVLELEQTGETVTIRGTLSNLTPGKHGISVCESGDVSDIGNHSCGAIFNPFGKTHGAETDDNRMVGDIGNLQTDDNGDTTVDISDSIIRLIGPHSIIGRSIVIFSGEDDQGRGGHENSLTTGNAGPRVAAGVIGIKL